MQVDKVEISLKGKPIMVDAIRVNNNVLIITGKLFKTVRIKDEWDEDVEDPDSIIKALKDLKNKPDIFTFRQRLPDTRPKYNLYMEWAAISAIPIKGYDFWLEKQIPSDTRKKIKRAQKRGVELKVVDFNDELVKGIMGIYNETPIRQGKPFWHYGKDFETVKRAMSRDLDKSDFIGAYYNGNLIGFVKLNYWDHYANPGQIISKIEYRKKYINNALIAKAVEVCATKEIPYLTYRGWRKGNHAAFLRRHGFEKMLLPRYYVPLSIKGRIILKLKLHRGIKGILPEKTINWLLDLRAKWFSRKYRNAKIN